MVPEKNYKGFLVKLSDSMSDFFNQDFPMPQEKNSKKKI